MTAKVTRAFRDGETWVSYEVGDTYVGAPARVAELAEGGYVEATRPATKPKAAPKRRATRKTAPKE